MLEKALNYKEKFQKEKESMEYQKGKKIEKLEQHLTKIYELEEVIKVYQEYDKDPKKIEYELGKKIKSLKIMYEKEKLQIPLEMEKYNYLEKMLKEKEESKSMTVLLIAMTSLFALVSYCMVMSFFYPSESTSVPWHLFL